MKNKNKSINRGKNINEKTLLVKGEIIDNRSYQSYDRLFAIMDASNQGIDSSFYEMTTKKIRKLSMSELLED